MDSLKNGASFQEFQMPTTFPFQRLPMELQLYMLQHFLISPVPILNAGIPRSKQKFRVKGEEQSLRQIHPSILSTCKLFYAEGIPLLYGRNTFMYTGPWRGFEHILLSHDGEKTPLAVPMTEQMPEFTRDFKSALSSFATSIHLRLRCTSDTIFDHDCHKLLEIVGSFTNLRKLRWDALTFTASCWRSRHGSLGRLYKLRWISKLQSVIRQKLQDPNPSTRALNEIVLTGLPHTDMGLSVVQQYARLLAPDGIMGVGWGVQERRLDAFTLWGDSNVTLRADLNILWMEVGELWDWIAKEQHTVGSKWLFDMQNPEWNVALPKSSQLSNPGKPSKDSSMDSGS